MLELRVCMGLLEALCLLARPVVASCGVGVRRPVGSFEVYCVGSQSFIGSILFWFLQSWVS